MGYPVRVSAPTKRARHTRSRGEGTNIGFLGRMEGKISAEHPPARQSQRVSLAGGHAYMAPLPVSASLGGDLPKVEETSHVECVPGGFDPLTGQTFKKCVKVDALGETEFDEIAATGGGDPAGSLTSTSGASGEGGAGGSLTGAAGGSEGSSAGAGGPGGSQTGADDPEVDEDTATNEAPHFSYMDVEHAPFGFHVGDAILNRYAEQGHYVDPCVARGNCPPGEVGEDATDANATDATDVAAASSTDWRSIKQTRKSASDMLENELKQTLIMLSRKLQECEEGFPADPAREHACVSDYAQRACDKYTDVIQTCDWSEEMRVNADNTTNFPESFKMKVCDGEERAAFDSFCPSFTKLPGVSVTHWPWQDFNINMGASTFSADALIPGMPRQWAP